MRKNEGREEIAAIEREKMECVRGSKREKK